MGAWAERPSKFVECPVCQTPVDEAAVNTHLDACLQSASGNDVRLALPAHTRSQAAKAWTSLACPTPNTRVSQRKRSKQAQAITPGKSDWPKPTKLAYSMVSVATLRQICIVSDHCFFSVVSFGDSGRNWESRVMGIKLRFSVATPSSSPYTRQIRILLVLFIIHNY